MTSMIPPGTDLNTTPASVSPDGHYDFNSPDQSARLFYIVSAISLVPTTAAVFLKVYIRAFCHKQFGLDDGLTVIAFALHCVQRGLAYAMMMGGATRHQWDMSLATFLATLPLQNRIAKVQVFTLLTAKLALVCLFYRLFSPKLVYKWIIISSAILIFVSYMTIGLIFVIDSTNIPLLLSTNEALGIVGLVTDVILGVIPISAVASLNLPRAKKIGVAAIFGTGLIGIGLGALSLYYRYDTRDDSASQDDTYDFTARMTAQVVEIDIGIVVGCVPIFPALMKKTIITQWFTTTFGSLRRLVGTWTRTNSAKSDHYYNLSSRRKEGASSTEPTHLDALGSSYISHGKGSQERVWTNPAYHNSATSL